MKKSIIRINTVKFVVIIGVLFIAINFYSCEFSIQNPGPVEDKQLNNRETFPTLINGMRKNFARAQNFLAYTGAAASKEITAAGGTQSFGITNAQRKGNLLSSENDDQWNYAQQARWIAEDGVRRMKEQLGDGFSSSKFGAQGLLWNGYANRLLGENMCMTIINGGAPQKNRVYFERAEKDFTEAINIFKKNDNTNLLIAAYAGRASIRVYLDKWDGAISDAKQVPIDFVFASQRTDIKTSEYNRLYWSNANQPYRAHSVVDTYYEDYYKKYGDLRVSWDTDPDIQYGVGGRVPWLFQTKYTEKSSPMNLSDGHEMLLIRAEAELRDGNWKKALDLINSIRDRVGVKLWKASNKTEAWTRLKRERGIELWLEARRLGDLRRWKKDNIPGKMEDMSGRDLCFPIGQDEKESNPHID